MEITNKNLSKGLVTGLMSMVVVVGTLIAQVSSSTCILWWFEQPKMPEKLIKRD
ncbi:MAG: cyclic lactone autoinducer peptide [Clostridia bacterium]|nr:cyclic lactone autoinducer peptide [Clostridia bacterium]